MPTFVKSVVEQGSEGAVTPRVNVRRPSRGGGGGSGGTDCTGAASQHTRLSPPPARPAPPRLPRHPRPRRHQHQHQHPLGYSHFSQRPQVSPSCRATGMTQNFDPSLTGTQMYLSLASCLSSCLSCPLSPGCQAPFKTPSEIWRNRLCELHCGRATTDVCCCSPESNDLPAQPAAPRAAPTQSSSQAENFTQIKCQGLTSSQDAPWAPLGPENPPWAPFLAKRSRHDWP